MRSAIRQTLEVLKEEVSKCQQEIDRIQQSIEEELVAWVGQQEELRAACDTLENLLTELEDNS